MLGKLMKTNRVGAFFLHYDKFLTDPNIPYLSGLDGLSYESLSLLHTGKKALLLTSGFEVSRAKKEGKIPVGDWSDFGYRDFVKKTKDPQKALMLALVNVLKKERVKKLWVPKTFPSYMYNILKRKVNIEYLPPIINQSRCVKRKDEIKHMKKAQKSNDLAMQAAIDMIGNSNVKGNSLYLKGKKLTESSIKQEISKVMVERGATEPSGNIVACGSPAADPHYQGTSRPLKKQSPIIIDIFPKQDGRYWSDCTRTVVKGKPKQKIIDAYDAILEALNSCEREFSSGDMCADVYNRACEILEGHGYHTMRDNLQKEKGFIHGLGHGVGLDIHEAPNLTLGSPDKLSVNQVVTVEPGLYYSSWGGIRIEDMTLVTKKKLKSFTKLKKEFILR